MQYNTHSSSSPKPAMTFTKARNLDNVEQNWCRAASSGTGITGLVLELAKPPSEASVLQKILDKLQQSHPILGLKLHHNNNTKSFSLHTSSAVRHIQIDFYDAAETSNLLRTLSDEISPAHFILEHVLNSETWSDPKSFPSGGIDVLYAGVYALSESKTVVALRLHPSICDRTTAVELLMEMMKLDEERESGGTHVEIRNEGEGKMGIESLVTEGMKKKTLWSHGMDMLGYSVSSLSLSNLKFNSAKGRRRSEVVRFQINKQFTALILARCKSRGIKLCGALTAASLMAAHSQNHTKKKYGVVTIIDCRSCLQPPLPAHHFGFYQCAVLTTQSVKGSENLWDLAANCYKGFESYKKCKRHLSDLTDLNFLMGKAMENPSLTPSSSLRTSVVSVFEDPVVDNSYSTQQKIGVEDYIGCASVHGIGPSIGLFDTIRNGALDCACVYPAPLHSRDQISGLVHRMKKLLIDSCY